MNSSRILNPSLPISIAGVCFGCAFSILFLPPSVQEPNDLFLSALSLALGLTSGPILASLKTSTALLHPVSILQFGIVYWILLDLIQGLYIPEVISTSVIKQAFFAISLFSLGINILGCRHNTAAPKFLIRAASFQANKWTLFYLSSLAFSLAIARFLIPANFNFEAIYSSFTAGRFSAVWTRGAYGGWDAFLDHLSYFGYFLPSLAILIYRTEKKISFLSTSVASMAVIIVLFLSQGGGRRIVGALIISAGLAWILSSPRIGRSIFNISIFGIPSLLTLLQYLLLIRNEGFDKTIQIRQLYLPSSGVSVDDNFNRLSQIIEIVPQYIPHVGLDWLLWILVRPIPRVLWEGKPDGYGFNLAEILNLPGVSLTSSVVGESYLAFGMIGCLVLGAGYGYLAGILNKILHFRTTSSGIIVYALGISALFVGIRSAIEILLFSYAVLAWTFLVLTASLIKKKSVFRRY